MKSSANISEIRRQSAQIDLVLWDSVQPDLGHIEWPFGEKYIFPPIPAEVHLKLEQAISDTKAECILFWDIRLGYPNCDLIQMLQMERIDIWHAGLLLGTSGEPYELDYISPTWMLNRDPDGTGRAISWRLSLHACLCRTRVLKTLGSIDPAFETLMAAGLEMGYRYIRRGAVSVNEPKLLNSRPPFPVGPINFRDRYVFLERHFSPRWVKYVLLRRVLAGKRVYRELKAYNQAKVATRSHKSPFHHDTCLVQPHEKPVNFSGASTITVLIPTLRRYPYLEKTLQMLRTQTIKPEEVICIDQTPQPERRPSLYDSFKDLNIKVIWRDTPGQCSARNAGLTEIDTSYVLFLDDDVKIKPDYIERLLEALNLYKADIAGGVWSQDQDQAIAIADRIFRVSDRFAGGNSLASLEVIQRSGGFDLHYDRNYRADADLGMRLYLAGAISIITPEAKEHSYSAPIGGLKFFGTFDGVRKVSLLQPWPATTQTYYWLRYHSRRQVREAFFLNFLAASIPREARHSASVFEKTLSIIRQLWTFPFRVWGGWRSMRIAQKMKSAGPRIPGL